MCFWTYILLSRTTKKIYIGHTSDLTRRLIQHNDSKNQLTRYTKQNQGPWDLLYSETYSTRSEAMRREKELKGGQGRAWIKKTLTGGLSA